eukprot:176427-Prorocentrum_lima.AAC.1
MGGAFSNQLLHGPASPPRLEHGGGNACNPLGHLCGGCNLASAARVRALRLSGGPDRGQWLRRV